MKYRNNYVSIYKKATGEQETHIFLPVLDTGPWALYSATEIPPWTPENVCCASQKPLLPSQQRLFNVFSRLTHVESNCDDIERHSGVCDAAEGRRLEETVAVSSRQGWACPSGSCSTHYPHPLRFQTLNQTEGSEEELWSCPERTHYLPCSARESIPAQSERPSASAAAACVSSLGARHCSVLWSC